MAPRPDVTPRPGAVPEFELELDVRQAPTPASRARTEEAADAPLELAVDAGALVRERAATELATSPVGSIPDIAFDARLLADYGDPPGAWLLSPVYAWRVFRRRRELKAALAGRRAEADRALGEVDGALVTFSERVRPVAEQSAEYRDAVEALRQADELLRSRDQVLAVEQDAQGARLSQVDARLSSLEAQLTQARRDERDVAAELSAAEDALAREESRLRRAEIELRAALQRVGGTVE